MSVDFAALDRALNRRRRSQKRLNWLTALLTNLALLPVGAWYVMLAVGIAHHEWLPMLPTLGYWWALILVVLLRSAFATVSPRDLRLDDFLDGKA